MTSATVLHEWVERLSGLRRAFRAFEVALLLVRTGIIAFCLLLLWVRILPDQELVALLFAGLSSLGLLLTDWFPRPIPFTVANVKIGIEMSRPDSPTSLLEANEASEHEQLLHAAYVEQVTLEKRRILRTASTLVLPGILVGVLSVNADLPLQATLANAIGGVYPGNTSLTLEVIRGASESSPREPVNLDGRTLHSFELLLPNLIELKWIGPRNGRQTIELRNFESADKGSAFQTFQMIHREHEVPPSSNISFAVTHNVEIIIPEFSRNPLARITVRELPLPKVTLSAHITPDAFWPDDRPIDLQISANAINPLQALHLVISVDGKELRELVNTITSDKVKDFATTYSLTLEPYVDHDLAEVEIAAEATDRSLPIPLVGRSNSIHIKTASAYGRYQRTLQTLYKLKNSVDQALGSQSKRLPDDAKEIISSAALQSRDTAFFDGLDRIQIAQMQQAVDEIQEQESLEEIYDLSTALNNFLGEHELIDDRERDRDFFVAARGLSRIIEQPKAQRLLDEKTANSRMLDFLKERQKRWALRVERLRGREKLKGWSKIGAEKSVESSLRQIDDLDSKDKSESALPILSQTVMQYRAWIEELESLEDEERVENDQERQRGLASARNELVEIQKKQAYVSALLDQADKQQKDQLDTVWPVARTHENTNIRDTQRLEYALRAISPPASNRIKAAAEAMEAAITEGNKESYPEAETFADLAGRLLRKAEKDTQASQQNASQRRRRRVSGDKYHGQTILGGDIDISREYKVDSQYREEILNEVSDSSLDEDSRMFLDNYLRRVVR